jgi:DinB superfamily
MKELLDELAATPATVRSLVGSAPDLDRRIGDFFSLRENVAHLRDIDELGYAIRIRRTLAEECPSLPDVKGDRVAVERGYATLPVEPELQALEQSRAASIALLRAADDAALDRVADLETVGRITIRKMLELWVEHDRGHLQAMRELLAP